MFLQITGYGLAAIGAYGGYQNYKKLQVDVGEASAVKALLGLDPTGIVKKQPAVIQQASVLDAAISQDQTALLIDAGLIAIGLFVATRDR